MKNDILSEEKKTGFHFQYWQRFLISLSAILSSLVLFGWFFNVGTLKRPLPGLAAMNPVTSICFILSSASLFLLTGNHKIKLRQNLGTGIAFMILAVALIKLASLFWGLDTRIDYLLFNEQLKADAIINHTNNRMAPNTAFAFVFTSLSLIFIDVHTRKKRVPSQYFALVIGVVGMISVLGYIYKVQFLSGFLLYIPMAIHTGICFLLIALAILFTHPYLGLMAELTGDKAGAASGRLLIPAAIIVPIGLGFLRLYGAWAGILPFEFGTALLILSIMMIFILLIWFTVTELNKKDALRAAAEAQLQATNKELEAFSYSVSHDLRAPLRAVHGYAQMINEDYETALDDEGRRILEAIKSNAKKMGTLIDDLLAFSRLGRKEVQKTKIDLDVLVKEVVADINSSITHHAKIIIGNFYSVQGDYSLLHQVIFNLVSNAVKYSSKKENPVIEISSENKEGKYIFYVKDNGAGFDMNYAGKLFSVFQRLHTQKEFDGTGVGLAIVHRIIEKHGGKVWAEGKVGEGAAFYFMLP